MANVTNVSKTVLNVLTTRPVRSVSVLCTSYWMEIVSMRIVSTAIDVRTINVRTVRMGTTCMGTNVMRSVQPGLILMKRTRPVTYVWKIVYYASLQASVTSV